MTIKAVDSFTGHSVTFKDSMRAKEALKHLVARVRLSWIDYVKSSFQLIDEDPAYQRANEDKKFIKC